MVRIESTVDHLADYKTRKYKVRSDELKEVLATGSFKGASLKGKTPVMGYVEGIVEGLREAIRGTFNIYEETLNVIGSTKITCFQNFPKSDAIEFSAYGEKELQLFAEHFQQTLARADPKFNVEDSLREWRLVKRDVIKRFSDKLFSATWDQVLPDSELSNVSLIINLMLTIPPTSVSCETTFSPMKLIKTSRRTRLSGKTLNDLLLVKLESKDIVQFNPEPAINHWMETSLMPRRITYTRATTTGTPLPTSDPDHPESATDILTETTHGLSLRKNWNFSV